MYNDKYYNVLDFDTLLLELNTDVGVSYSTNSNYNL
uniref:Nuclear cap-binding protein subunit 1-binding, m7GpppA, transcription, mRNA n=1 Tax=Podoviridae sp. ct8Lf7 TaxID=2827723 RepID=A0A8S5S0K3_9CAUD|nr:MAG TPA: Nuclear cap-binding protein subunit 1-binding, m7GpppA, transcription, mRNA [Podoviridae sp. ct8Lf7]